MKKELPWDLILPKLKNDITYPQQAALDAWLADGDNSILLAHLEVLWSEIRAEASGYEPDVEECWQKLSERLALSEANGLRAKRNFDLRRIAVAAAVVLAAATGGYFAKTVVSHKQPVEMSYSTMSGKSQVYLPDGTLVWLHNNTRLSYDAGFGKRSRTLTLAGEAYFEVVRNDLPFRVRADEVTVEVRGTKFNVRNRAAEDRITVSLLEGAVSVETPLSRETLSPGYEAVYLRNTQKMQRRKADVRLASSWTGESASFRQASLEDVVRHLAKWYDVDIRLEGDSSRFDFAYTFTLRGEPLEEVMRLIARISPVDYYFDENNVLYIDVKPN